MRISIIIIFSLSLYSVSKAQKDSSFVMQLHDKAYLIELSEPDSAIYYYDSAAAISSKIGYVIGEGRSYNYKAIVLFEQGRYLEAKAFNLLAIPLFDSIGYEAGVAACLVNLGNIELYLGNYEHGVGFYIRGIEAYEEAKDSAHLVTTFNNISTLFLNNQQADKGILYAQKSNTLSKLIGDSISLADSYINLANGYLMNGDLAKHIIYSTQAFQIAQKTHDLYNQILASNNIANHYIQKNNIDSANYFAQKTLELARSYKNPYNICEALSTLGKVAYNKGDLDIARNYLHEAEDISIQYKLSNLRLAISYQLYVLENSSGYFRKAANYLATYTTLKDSINTIETKKYVHLLEQKFENEKKERTIENQQLAIVNQEKIIGRNNLLFIAAVLILLLLGTTIAFMFRSARQKSNIHGEHVKRMKAEQIILSTHSVVEGQEQERKRISRELHDGVNGGLAAIRLMATNYRKKNDQAIGFEDIETMVEELSTEVREISHNLMPGTLAKGSLKESLEELVFRLNHSDQVDFELQVIGNIDKGGENTKFYTYRIIQELLKNVLHHARASSCILQLSEQNGSLNICVEDNGIGMSPKSIAKSKSGGIGMKNIESRISYLNGSMETESSAGKGTTFYITIPTK